jgi:hypothetical protein
MNTNRRYLKLNASDWPTMTRQVKTAVIDCWHQHAGRWQPENITLHVATGLLPDSLHGAQRATHLPPLVAWLRQQGHAITLLGDSTLPEHRLYLDPPLKK